MGFFIENRKKVEGSKRGGYLEVTVQFRGSEGDGKKAKCLGLSSVNQKENVFKNIKDISL